MAEHAGFAGAVTIRENVLKTALLAAYANGALKPGIKGDIPLGPPAVYADLYMVNPDIHCEAGPNVLVVNLPVWGSLRVTLNGNTSNVNIVGEIVLTIKPKFTIDRALLAAVLSPEFEDISIRNWIATIVSTGIPADVVSFITGNEFKTRLEIGLRAKISGGDITLPSIDISFLDRLAFKAKQQVEAKVTSGALLLGLNVDDDDNQVIGDIGQLSDFAQSNDVAGVVNTEASAIFLDTLYTKMNNEITAQGGTLSGFSVMPAAGYFYVSGAASNSTGTINFSFHLVPMMTHTLPGKYFSYLQKPRWVRSRTWPALEFRIEGVETDVDRSWWVVLIEIFSVVLTAHIGILVIEDMVSSAAHSFSGKLKASKSKAVARIQRTIPPPGGIAVRIGVEVFEITSDGTFFGISVAMKQSPGTITGPSVIPLDYISENLVYTLSLPSGLFENDPNLRVRWTITNQTNGGILIDDGVSAGRLKKNLQPSSQPGALDYNISATIYRQLGTFSTELIVVSLNLKIREALPPNAYVRWRSDVKNPQIGFNKDTEEWSYNGEALRRRWSEWHRTDAPCRAVNASGRYRYKIEMANKLPFPLRLIDSHRKGLCPYCFYGSPTGSHYKL